MFKQIIQSVLVISVILSVTPSITYARGDSGGDVNGGGACNGANDSHTTGNAAKGDDGCGRNAERGKSQGPFPPLPIALTFCDRAITGSSQCIDERL